MQRGPESVSRLEQWRRAHKLTYGQLGRRIGAKGTDTARRYCLPSDHADHRIPSPLLMVNIYLASDGEVRPDHFYDLPPLIGVALEACA